MDFDKELEPPSEFPFPFEPYGIQKDFMRHLYQTLERRKIGIFESPTGTVVLAWTMVTSVEIIHV